GSRAGEAPFLDEPARHCALGGGAGGRAGDAGGERGAGGVGHNRFDSGVGVGSSRWWNGINLFKNYEHNKIENGHRSGGVGGPGYSAGDGTPEQRQIARRQRGITAAAWTNRAVDRRKQTPFG